VSRRGGSPKGASLGKLPPPERVRDDVGQWALALDGTDPSSHIGEIERWAAARGIGLLLGVDEAGKGPLAGPVVAGACALPPDHSLDDLRDSKQLTEAQREALFPRIQAVALGHGVGAVDAAEIDRIGLQPATHRAMHLAIAGALRAAPRPGLVVVDGKIAIPDLALPQKTFVKGDDRSYAIAAASILAKVTRDRLMCHLDSVFPGYGFADHKGYGTPEHQRQIRTLGLCPIHRRSFRISALAEWTAPGPDANARIAE
jgi:ribonuclease HII